MVKNRIWSCNRKREPQNVGLRIFKTRRERRSGNRCEGYECSEIVIGFSNRWQRNAKRPCKNERRARRDQSRIHEQRSDNARAGIGPKNRAYPEQMTDSPLCKSVPHRND